MIRCGWCGRFISYNDKDAITYTNFGGHYDTEPPDAIDVCGKCWNKLSSAEKYFYKKFTWRPATKLFKVTKC